MSRWYRSAALIAFNTLLLLAVLELLAALTLVALPAPAPSRVVASYYAAQEWGSSFLSEDSHAVDDVGYAPYVLWRTKPYEGRYVRVDGEGNRVTPGSVCAADSYKVLMFGGSTMWGYGVPDWATIPAYLRADLSARIGRPLCLLNLGQPGWVSGQSVIELVRRLQAGDVPDEVIFYDGFNDVGVLWSDGMAGGPYRVGGMTARLDGAHGLRHTGLELVVWTHMFRLLERFMPSVGMLRDWPARYTPPVFEQTTMTRRMVQNYMGNYDVVKALASEYHFRYAMFWQPTLHYTSRQLNSEERQFIDEGLAQEGFHELIHGVYDAIRTESLTHDRLFFLADMFDAGPENLFVDSAHLTHVGNQKVAARMLDLMARGR